MTPTGYNKTHHGWLKQIESNLEEMIDRRSKKAQLATVRDGQFDELMEEKDQLTETLFKVIETIRSYESTFEIN